MHHLQPQQTYAYTYRTPTPYIFSFAAFRDLSHCPFPTRLQLVSKVTLQTFMDTFNEIAHAAHSNDDTFYSQVSHSIREHGP